MRVGINHRLAVRVLDRLAAFIVADDGAFDNRVVLDDGWICQRGEGQRGFRQQRIFDVRCALEGIVFRFLDLQRQLVELLDLFPARIEIGIVDLEINETAMRDVLQLLIGE